MPYAAHARHTEDDYDIWNDDEGPEQGNLGVFKNFSDAKKAVLKDNDMEIAHLKRRRQYIKSMKKSEVFKPQGQS